jgi:phosphonate transport system substrate-binding protein
MSFKKIMLMAVVAATIAPLAAFALPDGSKENPLRVLMVPADTGTNDITKDYGPVFEGITKNYGIHFDIKSGASYAAVVEGMCGDKADIAWFGAVTYGQAKEKCGVELLAVDVEDGDSSYYSGLFVRKDSGIKSVADLKGKTAAFGSTSSTSSFNFPVAMIIAAGVDPVKDLSKVVIAGSHSASLAALSEGKVDMAAASYNSFEKAAQKGAIDPALFMTLEKSQPIPNPPLAMNKGLTPELKAKLRLAFSEIHTKIDPSNIRGYGGKKVDRYDTNFDEKKIFEALSKLNAVTSTVKAEMVEKAGQR